MYIVLLLYVLASIAYTEAAITGLDKLRAYDADRAGLGVRNLRGAHFAFQKRNKH